MLLVGDVTGRGAEAAALTGQARHTLRTAGMLLGDPAAAFEQLNQALAAARRADAVHGRADPRRAGRAAASRSSAPAIRSRC